MGHERVYRTVSSVVPCAHMAFPDDSAPNPPFATYTVESQSIWACNRTVAVRNDYTVELYESKRDAELEKALGAAIEAEFGGYDRRESWIQSEQCLMVSYDFAEIEGEHDG